jgi:hypothetical protein
MATIEVDDIFVYTGQEYFSLRPYYGNPVNSIKARLRYVSDGVELYPIYSGMRTLVSDGVDLYFMSDTTTELSASDFVCQVEGNYVYGSDFVCENVYKYYVP